MACLGRRLGRSPSWRNRRLSARNERRLPGASASPKTGADWPRGCGVTGLKAGLIVALALGVAGCEQPRVTTIIQEPKPLPGTPVESLVRIGDSMRQSGDPEDAANIYLAAVGRDQRAPVPLIRLGEVQLELGRVPQAQQSFRAALVLAPGDATASADLAIALLASGQPAEALPLIEPVARGSHDPRVLRNYGVTLDMLGRSADAQAAYRRALTQFPADADLHGNLALSLAVSGDLAGAQQEMDAAINLPNAPAHLAASRVLLLAMEGQDGAARDAGRLLPNPADAETLIEQGHRAAAATTPAERAAILGLVNASSPPPAPPPAPAVTAPPPARRAAPRVAAKVPAAAPHPAPSPPPASP